MDSGMAGERSFWNSYVAVCAQCELDFSDESLINAYMKVYGPAEKRDELIEIMQKVRQGSANGAKQYTEIAERPEHEPVKFSSMFLDSAKDLSPDEKHGYLCSVYSKLSEVLRVDDSELTRFAAMPVDDMLAELDGMTADIVEQMKPDNPYGHSIGELKALLDKNDATAIDEEHIQILGVCLYLYCRQHYREWGACEAYSPIQMGAVVGAIGAARENAAHVLNDPAFSRSNSIDFSDDETLMYLLVGLLFTMIVAIYATPIIVGVVEVLMCPTLGMLLMVTLPILTLVLFMTYAPRVVDCFSDVFASGSGNYSEKATNPSIAAVTIHSSANESKKHKHSEVETYGFNA